MTASAPPDMDVETVYRQVRDALRHAGRATTGDGDVAGATETAISRGLSVVALRTPTLPPALHTSCYMVGTSAFAIVDPGAVEASERDALAAIIDRRQAAGDRLGAVWLTHHHGDHVGAADFVRARFGVPVLAHAVTAERLEAVVEVDRTLDDGEALVAAGAPSPWRALFTPGHAPGHLCFVRDAARDVGAQAIVGDMVAGIGTILIDPSEGDMAAYLASLRRLQELGATALLPAHGPVIADGPGKLAEYVAHRLRRERAVLDAVAAIGPAPAAALVQRAYADTPRWLWGLAERSLLAHLVKLVADGVLIHAADDDTWRLSAAPTI